tara:strand:+ start:359 stop:622 length:264 start_codon:yes stop_codon:yes gene_type:complete
MLKEIKYLFYILTIFIFLFFTIKFYFSEKNIKNSYRSIDLIDDNIKQNQENIIVLKDDTKNIIEYIEENSDDKESEYKFWELLQKTE